MMTREDMLRELELLPVWQLRAPIAVPALKVDKSSEKQLIEINAEKSAYEKPLSISPEEANSLSFATDLALDAIDKAQLNDVLVAEAVTYQCVASDDDAYLFVLSSDAINADETALQRNIWRAMRLNMQAITSLDLDSIDLTKHKIMISMGERVAQQLLATDAPLSELRSSVRQFKNIALVATFDAASLLQNPQYKPQAWADLCLAMQTLKSAQ